MGATLSTPRSEALLFQHGSMLVRADRASADAATATLSELLSVHGTGLQYFDDGVRRQILAVDCCAGACSVTWDAAQCDGSKDTASVMTSEAVLSLVPGFGEENDRTVEHLKATLIDGLEAVDPAALGDSNPSDNDRAAILVFGSGPCGDDLDDRYKAWSRANVPICERPLGASLPEHTGDYFH